MNVELFKDLTTEDHLQQIEAEASKYSGLYVDMEDKEQRKFVKDKASLISGLLKKIERARIDKSKDYKLLVEAEAKSIKERLEAANLPFTALIDEHKRKRAEILAKEKAEREAKELAIQIEKDHEEAIMMEKIRVFELEEEKRKQKEYEEEIARKAREQAEREKIEAEERAEQAERDRILAEEKAKRDAIKAEKDRIEAEKQAEIRAKEAAERARQEELDRIEAERLAEEERQRKIEANKRHVGMVRSEIKEHIMSEAGLSEDEARKVVKSLINFHRITINY